MSKKKRSFDSQGQASPKQNPTPRIWQGWKGELAHPGSPSGGGGIGAFREANPLGQNEQTGNADESEFVPPHPDSPIPLQDKAPKTTGAKPNPAPKQETDGSAVELVKKKDAFVDVEVKYQVMADEINSSTGGGVTKFKIHFPDFSPPDKPKKGDPGTVTWRTTIKIRTKYNSEQMRDFYSCYGRGTTAADRQAGDITVGFHEACHREDYENYLNANDLPEIPDLKAGMSINDFNKAQNKFSLAYDEYSSAMKLKSDNDTDEVGLKKSKWKASGGTGAKCFKHNPKV